MSSNASETGSTRPREYKWGATWKKNQWLRFRKLRLTAVAESTALITWHYSIRKSWHQNLSTGGGRSVSIVCFQTKSHGVCLLVFLTKVCRPHTIPHAMWNLICQQQNSSFWQYYISASHCMSLALAQFFVCRISLTPNSLLKYLKTIKNMFTTCFGLKWPAS
jgi:hypothetical protein